MSRSGNQGSRIVSVRLLFLLIGVCRILLTPSNHDDGGRVSYRLGLTMDDGQAGIADLVEPNNSA
jgi:hypothetical protein